VVKISDFVLKSFYEQSICMSTILHLFVKKSLKFFSSKDSFKIFSSFG